MPRDPQPFGSPAKSLHGLGAGAFARIAGVVGDLALVLTRRGEIRDVAWATHDPVGRFREGWIGADWAETATVESRPKIAEMLAEAQGDAPPRWRQINHPSAHGDVPMRYLVVGDPDSDHLVAIGVDLGAMSALQQRLIQTQQSLERDYLKLRQAESRYRLLFDLDSDAVLVVDAEGRRIREANPAAHRLARAKPGALVNRGIASLFAGGSQDDVVALLGGAIARSEITPVAVLLSDGTAATAHATAFRQDRAAFVLMRIAVTAPETTPAGSAAPYSVLDNLPDAAVLTDAALNIVYANVAFLDLVQEVSSTRVIGAPLGTWLGRAGIDLDLVVEQVRQYGVARNVATIVRDPQGAAEEVEVSAAATADEGYAFSVRAVGRRIRDLPPAPQDLPRSVEQLTDLVGRMSLKDIVRESTDLIERLCIEAALEYTSDNRASAAEILGLSRQSLYSKLHRHGLGNLEDDSGES